MELPLKHVLASGALAALLAACGASGSSPEPTSPVAPPKAAVAPAFENPGGMWMPSQMAQHAETLKRQQHLQCCANAGVVVDQENRWHTRCARPPCSGLSISGVALG